MSFLFDKIKVTKCFDCGSKLEIYDENKSTEYKFVCFYCVRNTKAFVEYSYFTKEHNVSTKNKDGKYVQIKEQVIIYMKHLDVQDPNMPGFLPLPTHFVIEYLYDKSFIYYFEYIPLKSFITKQTKVEFDISDIDINDDFVDRINFWFQLI